VSLLFARKDARFAPNESSGIFILRAVSHQTLDVSEIFDEELKADG
jgi:hypothetical protein